MITPRIGYVDLSQLELRDVDAAISRFSGAETIIFDLRGYPRGTGQAISQRLAKVGDGIIARFFRKVVLTGPAEFGDVRETLEFDQKLRDSPVGSTFSGRTIALINEGSVSQAEHTALGFKSINGMTLVGSRTSGTNGDVSYISLPGGLTVSFSGQGVRRAGGGQLQRVGILPDFSAEPSIAGVSEGRDEVLEFAVELAEKIGRGSQEPARE